MIGTNGKLSYINLGNDKMTAQLTKDVAELAKRLGTFYEFYYSLIEAKYIPLNLTEPPKDYIHVIQVDKEEWERWKKIKSIIDNFEVPN